MAKGAKDKFSYPGVPGVFNPETFANELSENLNASFEPGGGSSDIAKGYAPKHKKMVNNNLMKIIPTPLKLK